MLRYRCFIFVTAITVPVFGLLGGCPSVSPPTGGGTASGFVESWESVAWETRAPGGSETFRADAGNWYLGDTASNVEHCMPTPHLAELITHRGSKAIRLTSNESPFAENVWIQFINEEVAHNAVNIPISPSTQISFYEEGTLLDLGPPSPCGWYSCEITLEVEDTQGNLVVYVLQRSTGGQRDVPFYSVEIILDGDAGHQQRNLYEDFRLIPRFSPSGARVRAVTLSIDNNGWVILDDLVIADDAGAVDD